MEAEGGRNGESWIHGGAGWVLYVVVAGGRVFLSRRKEGIRIHASAVADSVC